MDYLEHHGIKGMKWGIRRTPEQLRYRAKGAAKSVKSKVKSNLKKNKNSEIEKMSDEELRRRINRMQMERQYKQLKKRDLSTGEKFVKEIVREIGKDQAKKYINKGVQLGIDYLVKG